MRASGRLLQILAAATVVACWLAPAVAGGSAYVVVPAGDDVVLVGGDSDDEDAAFLGVSMTEETEYPEGGARITGVVDDSPAAEAGLERGDIVVAVEGEPIRGPRRLAKRIAERSPGDRVRIDVLRDGSELGFDVELGRRSGAIELSVVPGASGVHVLRPSAAPAPLAPRQLLPLAGCDDEDAGCEGVAIAPGVHGWVVGGRPKLGVQLAAATPELREHLGAGRDEGVLVSKVLAGTPAAHGDIRVGDLIVAVQGETIRSAHDLIRALSDKDGETIEVELVRDGRRTGVVVTIAERGDGNGA